MKHSHIRFDWAMKRLLRDKANFGILEGFLSELLNDDIKIDHLGESESNQDDQIDKFNKVDILAYNNKQELILIEVQNNRELDYFQRVIYGVSKAISEHMQLGEDYSEVKKVYSINILYFDLGHGNDYVYHGITEFKGIHNQDILNLTSKQKKRFKKYRVADIFPEYYLLKVNEFDDLAKNTLDEWIYYLKNNEVLQNSKAKGLKEVSEKLQIDKMTKEDKKKYERFQENIAVQRSVMQTAIFDGLEEGFEKGMEKGMEKGREEGIELTISVIGQYNNGLTIEEIATNNNISIGKVKDILIMCNLMKPD